ncbi:uncharacterized protein [Arachis hypogaea]|uniref:uncharacterized protein n=1 Tax=Arachis hypogaea TaxID=3818 RepID=UPI000DEC97E7|nr:uncharacterized protein LOC112742320 [Arachis hypogaea]
MGLYSSYKTSDEGTTQPQSGVAKSRNPYVHQTNIGLGQPSKKKRQRCSVCQMEGHKKTTCPWQKDINNNVMEVEANGSDNNDMYTEPTPDLDNEMITHVRDIADFVHHKVQSPPILNGHSFGVLIIQYYISSLGSKNHEENTYPKLRRAILVCSVPPFGNSGLIWQYLFTKLIAAFKVTRSLAAKAFQTSLPLCRETFFSATMEDHIFKRYQELMKESSSLPLFNLRKLNASLLVPSAPNGVTPNCPVDVLVLGAKNDFIFDAEGLNETARFYSVPPDCVDVVAHDMMLDVSWEKGAKVILSWINGLDK